jgi:hypothetical protein
LCGLINQVYEAMGQLVANCNKSAAELAATWGSDEATTVLRRIGGGEGAHTILFEEQPSKTCCVIAPTPTTSTPMPYCLASD